MPGNEFDCLGGTDIECPPCRDGNLGSCMLRHARIMSTLSQVVGTLNSNVPQQEKFSRCLDTLQSELGLGHGTIMLLAPNGEELRVEGLSQGAGPAADAVRYKIGEGVTGDVLLTGKPAVIPDLSKERRFKDRIHQRRAQGKTNLSFICVPIIIKEETVGTLSVDSPIREDVQLNETRQMLEILASMIAHDVSMRRMMNMEKETFSTENERLRNELAERSRPSNIIGQSSAMREVFTRIHQVANMETTVLIRGETGTGKELVASAIHYASSRATKPFVKVNCAALNEGLLESELFGHEKGAFTGALYQRIGRMEEAEGGTLFLDEIGDFSPAIQIKMLRVLQEKEYQRVGSNETRRADVRILAATNVDLEKAVAEGAFRSDLYYRINVFPIHIAPLRKRKSDVLLLADFFVERLARRMGKPIRRISTTAINMLTAYHWPGNVRELENCLEHAILVASNEVIRGQDLPPTLQFPEQSVSREPVSLTDRIEVVERDCIVDALKRYNGNITAAARELGITARMVRYKIQKLGIATEELTRKRRRRMRPSSDTDG